MNYEETILDLRDLEENIDGFRVEYEWNARFWKVYFRFYGLEYNIDGLNGIWREHKQSEETILDST